MVQNNNGVFVRQEENPQSFIMPKDTKNWRTDSGKKHYCSLGAEVCQIQRVKKQKGCNLYWIISETTVKRLKEIIPFYHIYCLPLFRLTSLKAHFSLLITSFGGFCHLFVQDVAFLQRAHRDFSAELGCWSLQERKHQTSIQTGGEKNTSQTRPIQQQKHGQAPL